MEKLKRKKPPTRKLIIQNLNNFFRVKADWKRLRADDLIKIHESLLKIRAEIDEIFEILEEVFSPQVKEVSYIS